MNPGLALKILLLEDSDDDAELVEMELRKEFKFTLRRATDGAKLQEILREFDPDVVLSDFSLESGFDGLKALNIVQRTKENLPFIFVSGILGEERAIELIKTGATDYVLKDNLKRLNPAVHRALQEAEERTRRLRFERDLEESEERYFLALQGARDGLWDWDAKSNQLHVSTRFRAILGIPENDPIDIDLEKWRSRMLPKDAQTALDALERHLRGQSDYFEQETRLRRADDSWAWILVRGVSVRDAQGKATRMAGSLTDITERKLAEEEKLRKAFYDGLTGLPNRMLFMQGLEQCIQRAEKQSHHDYALLILNLDRFRYINDGLGYKGGDQVLIDAAQRLADLVEANSAEVLATLARLGGDEFALLFEDSNSNAYDAADRYVEQLRGMMLEPFCFDEHELYLSFSIGAVMGSVHYHRVEELMRDASSALLKAKNQGPNSYELFSSRAMPGSHVFKLEAELRKALAREELELQYQPVLSLLDGKVIGGEALVRWWHPERGMLLPEDFIPLASETNLIAQIGEWTLQTACNQMQSWKKEGHAPQWVAVNISPLQFHKQDLRALALRTLNSSGCDPRCLKLELTEGAVMRDVKRTLYVLRELREIGIRISLDDFGTGYSSLSHLKRLPLDTLKLDRSFVMDLPQNHDSKAIAQMIIQLGHTLKLSVTAEGVETKEQVRFLSGLGCDEMQGWLFSKALPGEQFERLLREGTSLEIAR